MKVHAFVFARGGSKGLPRKNIKLLDGRPLIAHAIDVARACPSLDGVIVSTDDAEIAEVARSFGAEVPFLRPPALASDTASEWLAWRHAIEWVQQYRGDFDIFVSLPATSPFRAVEDVEACIAILRDDLTVDVVTTVKKAERSPYFNMVALERDGSARLAIRAEGSLTRRQDAPQLYDMTTVAYAARPDFVLKRDGLFDGHMRVVEVPPERALDIDTPFDFALAEHIARARAVSANRPTKSERSDAQHS